MDVAVLRLYDTFVNLVPWDEAVLRELPEVLERQLRLQWIDLRVERSGRDHRGGVCGCGRFLEPPNIV